MEHKKPKLNRQTLLEDARFFGLLNLGLILTALGIVLFKSPNQFAFGGTSGLSVILATLFPRWNVGAFMWVINIALVVLGFCLLGRKSMGWTVYSSFALSFYVSLCEWIWPLSAPLTDDTFLEFCFAVLLPALGGAIVFNVGASTGGTDILAMILQKYTSMEIGRASFLSSSMSPMNRLLLHIEANYMLSPARAEPAAGRTVQCPPGRGSPPPGWRRDNLCSCPLTICP